MLKTEEDLLKKLSIADIERPTSDEVAAIVAQINAGSISPAINLTYNSTTEAFEASVGAGE